MAPRLYLKKQYQCQLDDKSVLIQRLVAGWTYIAVTNILQHAAIVWSVKNGISSHWSEPGRNSNFNPSPAIIADLGCVRLTAIQTMAEKPWLSG